MIKIRGWRALEKSGDRRNRLRLLPYIEEKVRSPESEVRSVAL